MHPTDSVSAMTTASPGDDAEGAASWGGLLVLAMVTLTVVTGELLPTAVLPQMSDALGVPQPQVGLLVSVWAAVVVLATFPLVELTRGRDRRKVIAGALVVFGGASLLTALAPTFPLAMASRVAAASVCGLLWASVNAHSAGLVPEEQLARAVAVVLAGATLGSVLGVPMAAAAGQRWGWRVPFLGLAALVAAVTLGVLAALPMGRSPISRGHAAPPPRPGTRRAVLGLASFGGLVLAGHFAAFTFITVFFATTTAPGELPGLLLIYGVASAAALILVGAVGDRRPITALLVSAGGVGIAAMALLARGHPVVDLAIAAGWGLSSGAVGPAVQAGVMRAAGEALRSAAGTAIPVSFNLGIAVGAAVGSGVLSRSGVDQLAVFAGALALAGAAGLAVTVSGPQHQRGMPGRRHPHRPLLPAAANVRWRCTEARSITVNDHDPDDRCDGPNGRIPGHDRDLVLGGDHRSPGLIAGTCIDPPRARWRLP